MLPLPYRALVPALFLSLAGCAAPTTQPVAASTALVEVEAQKQQEIALRSQLDQQARLLRVAYPLLKAGTGLCKDRVRSSLGVRVQGGGARALDASHGGWCALIVGHLDHRTCGHPART